ncbi:beta-galactosidase [Paenibacillus odorifer]|uniref:Beta-galactosidase n=1 Tax=Paenibacillus odorifer TaxID=189426 RepID=A0A1R0X7B5_9BACL|nr:MULTISPECIES: beta-galactosidase [Paenibacillus]ETT45848.1 beta-galactosidase [Paenibacillus sp. FSL H8-237]OMD16371.1 beta-galactosidase [Paenibacillus odorifer]OMD30439.1 beta-galactosidase [Paenibacillus odorifer]OME53944.1 beta-galactosidase [Paenibacillus odorifer]
MNKKHSPISSKAGVMLHGADYNPEQWLKYPEVLREDIRLMKLAGCNVMSVGIFSWVSLEPEEGVFTFEWLDGVLDSFAENGIYAILATPSGARPAWMSQKYPEVLRVERNRVHNLHGFRHNHCYTSPVYREKTAILNAKLAERYSQHPAIIGWHISNEFGGECHCELCQDAFREWLKVKYNNSLDEVNHAWWATFWSHTYTSWSQIESPAPHGETQVHGLNLDWRRFVSERTIDFCQHEINTVRPYNLELPITTNMHMIDGIDYRELAKILDVVSWDAYPDWHYTEDGDDTRLAAWAAMHYDLMRSFKKKPFLLMESTPSLTNWQSVSKLKRPGMHKLSSLQAVAHGSDSVQYFQWRKSRGSSEKFHGAVVDHSGHSETRVFQDVAEVGKTLAGMTEVVGTSTPAQTAIIFDWDNRWAIKDAQGIRNSGLRYEETVLQHYRALWELGIPVDIIGSGDDLSAYKLVVAPMLYLISEENGKRIEKYVEQGGTFLATYWSGVVNETDLCHLGGFPGPLRRTLGIWAEETEGLHSRDLNGIVMEAGNKLKLSGDYDAHEIAELIHLEGAEALGHYRNDFYAGRPALTVNRFGEGNAYHLATRVKETSFYVELYAAITSKAGITRAMDSELPAGVTAQLRTDGESDYVFVQNFSGSPQTVELDGAEYTDLETGLSAPALLNLAVNGLAMLKRKALV